MSLNNPLPFKLKIPGEDTIDWRGVRSVSYRLDGLLSLSDDVVTLEWKARRHTEHVGIGGVKDVVDESPIGTMEISRDLIARARVNGWFRPRLQMWGPSDRCVRRHPQCAARDAEPSHPPSG